MAFTFVWTGTGLDEEVFSFDLQQTEGEFAALRVEIRNPRVGLLAPGAALWASLAKDGVTLFYGRLVGLPESIAEDVISLSFVARPDDYDARKAALAAGLKVAPYYDPVWFAADRRADPDVALEARPALWHVDRVNHTLSVSSIVAGEAGLAEFGLEDVLAESVQISFRQTPVSRIACSATVQWAESAAGVVDLSGRLGRIESLTGQGLLEDWPQRGATIGGGWFVSEASGQRIDGAGVPAQLLTLKTANGNSYGLPLWSVQARLVAGYSVARDREETVAFTMAADVQPIVSEAREEELLTVSMSSAEIDQPIDAGGALPIGDLRRKSYFTTDRGRQSLEYLVQLCRARLLARARAVGVTWRTTFDQAAALTLRHSARIVDPRLPGGQATGKVVGYRLAVSGDSGEAVGEVTIACTIGRGGGVAAVPGTDTYAEAYAGGYTRATGSNEVEGGAGDVLWSWGAYTIDDDGVDLMQLGPGTVVEQLTVHNPASAQRALINGRTWGDISEALGALNEAYTEVALQLRPLVGGPFQTTIPVTTSPLAIPRTIDLEAR